MSPDCFGATTRRTSRNEAADRHVESRNTRVLPRRKAGLIAPQHLVLPPTPHATATLKTDLDEVDRRTIGHVMRETRGNKPRAAKRLGLTRTQRPESLDFTEDHRSLNNRPSVL
jgi:transcriptional regulator with GAF, ATPase, and Fis domain